MAGLMDYLLAQQAAQTSSQTAQNTGAAIPNTAAPSDALLPSQTDASGMTSVAPVTVPAAPRNNPLQTLASTLMGGTPTTAADQSSQPPGLDYNNHATVQAVQGANAQNPPQGGMANPGVYGLLPANLQHGTLRNVLGAIGDAFLVGSGHQAEYEPHMQNQQIGDAMAGFDPNNPAAAQAAIARVAATGAKGAAEMADKMSSQVEQAALRKQYMEYNNTYHQQLLDSRNDAAVQRAMPYVGAMVAGAKTPEDYAKVYDRAEIIAQRYGSKYHASDFGLPDKEDWQPGMTDNLGMTANGVTAHGDRVTGQAVSVSNNERNNSTRVQTTQMNNDQSNTNNVRSTDQSNTNNIRTTNQSNTNSIRHVGAGGGHPLIGVPSGNRPAASGPINLPKDQQGNYVAGGQPLTAAQAAALPAGHGIHFLGHDGQWHIRP